MEEEQLTSILRMVLSESSVDPVSKRRFGHREAALPAIAGQRFGKDGEKKSLMRDLISLFLFSH